MTQTDFLHLDKPSDSDAINIDALNSNADKLDEFARNANTAISAKASASDLTAETTARQTADTAIQSDAAKQRNALTAQINGGAKNRMSVESGTASSSVSWFQANGLSIPAGQYIVFFRNMESDDTDAATCRGIFFDASGGNASSYFQIPRGQDVFAEVTITTDAKSLRINQSDTVGHSAGDTMSFSGAMICRKSDWDISHDFVPYCPTMAELYQMILSQNGGTPLMMMGAPPEGEVGENA